MALTVQLRAQDLSLADGAAVSPWTNLGSAGGSWTQATAGFRPSFQSGVLSGRPAVRFDGADDMLDNTANISNFIAAADHMGICVARLNATPVINDVIFGDMNNNSVILRVDSTSPLNVALLSNSTEVASFTVVLGVPFVASFYRTGGSTFFAIQGGAYSSIVVGNGTLTGDLRIAASAAGNFGEIDIAELWLWNTVDLAELAGYVTEMLNLYGVGPAQNEPARDASSRRLWAYRKPVPDTEIEVASHVGYNVELMDRIRLQHFAGPEPLAVGWGAAPWQAPLMQVFGREGDPGAATVKLRCKDLTDYLCLMQDRAWTRKSGSAQLADGVARFNRGGSTRTFNRTSKAWHKDPSSGLYVEVWNNAERFTEGGTLYEFTCLNYLVHTAFMLGDVSGWSKSGTAVNGSALAADLTDTGPWDVPSTGILQGVKYTAGTTHTTDLYLSQTTTDIFQPGTGGFWPSFIHRTNSGEALNYAVQRVSDSQWWKESDGSWNASIQWNPMTGTAGAVARYKSTRKCILAAGGVESTVVCRVGLPSGGTSGRISHLFHAQLGSGICHMEPVVAQAATYQRSADQLLLSNDSGARVLNMAQGAFACEFMPAWSSADIGNNPISLWGCVFDANNGVAVGYDGTADNWEFQWEGGGSSTAAAFNAAVTASALHRIAIRWTGAQLEHGLAQRTLDIWVNGAKGTSAVGAALTETATADLEIGAVSGKASPGGILRNMHSYQGCPPDAVMARLPF